MFPDGFPGLGLLLLRIVLGVTLGTHAALYLAGGLYSFSIGFLVIVLSLGIVLGLLTPLCSALAGLAAAGILEPWMPLQDRIHFPALLAAGTAAALCLLGPGAFSLDARLFGRREILIPPSSTSSSPEN